MDLELACELARLILDLLHELARGRHDEGEGAIRRGLLGDGRLLEDVDEHG